MSGERGEVAESTEQERIQNEEEVNIHSYVYAIGDIDPLLLFYCTSNS